MGKVPKYMVAPNYIGEALKFLKKLGARTPNFCYNIGPKQMRNTSRIEDAFTMNGVQDIYFYVNGGGTLGGLIKDFRACFIDLDVGRDANKRYFKPSIVKRKKVALIDKLNKSRVHPSIIVETRNGYQAYWVLSTTNCERHKWEKVQRKLINLFGADPFVGKVNQIMRLPGTWWIKQSEGCKDKFLTTVIHSSNRKYSISQLENLTKDTSDHLEIGSLKTRSDSWKQAKANGTADFLQEQKVVFGRKNDGSELKSFLHDIAIFLDKTGMVFMSKRAWKFYYEVK